jgi:putative transposase
LMALFGRSQRRVCTLLGIARSTYRYPVKPCHDGPLRQRLRELAQKRRRWGCPHLHEVLRRQGLVINHKRTERLYREEGLSIRRRKRKKTTSELRVKIPDAARPNQHWAMDFMSDALFNGRKIRLLTLMDEYTRECLAIEVDTSINGVRVTGVLTRVAMIRGLPEVIKVDNGPEFIGKALDAWAYQRQIHLHFSRPGKPVDNRFIESFNGRFREECLNDNWFMCLRDARNIVESWRLDYNTARPHSSLNDLTPEEFVAKEQEKLQLNLVQSTG